MLDPYVGILYASKAIEYVGSLYGNLLCLFRLLQMQGSYVRNPYQLKAITNVGSFCHREVACGILHSTRVTNLKFGRPNS